MSKWKSRELVITAGTIIFALVAATVMTCVETAGRPQGIISSAQWVDIVRWIPMTMGAIFAAAKTVQKIKAPDKE